MTLRVDRGPLITIGEAVSQHLGSRDSIKYYAQELKENTYNPTRMNLVMRGIRPENTVCRCGDTLAEDWPWFEEGHPESYEPLFADAVVSNLPYSQRWDPAIAEGDPRFDGYGVAPKSKADYAFLLHDLYHFKPDGVMCIVLPHGVLFRGGEEECIRRALVENENIDAIIGLPTNIFFGTGIPIIEMVLKRRRASDDILIIDASKGFVKGGKQDKLRACDIRRVVDAYERRTDVGRFCRVISKQEVRDNGYNLNIPRYVDSSEQPETWDIYATMFGGVPTSEVDALHEYWDVLPNLRDELFEAQNRASMRLKADDVEKAVHGNASVRAFLDAFDERFSDFGIWLYDELVDKTSLVHLPTQEGQIANEVLGRLDDVALVDRYDAYQVIDEAWQQISNDIEIIQTEGFDAVCKVGPNMVTKKGGKEVEVQDGWVGHILPFDLVQHTLLADDFDKLEQAESRASAIDPELAEILEGLSEDDKAALGDALSEAGDAFVASMLKAIVRELGGDPDMASLADTADRVHSLLNEQKTLKKSAKGLAASHKSKTKETIEGLSDQQVRDLLDEKWDRPVVDVISSPACSAVEGLVDRVKALAQKCSTTFTQVDEEISHEEDEFAGLLSKLTGDDYGMVGIRELCSLLRGDAR